MALKYAKMKKRLFYFILLATIILFLLPRSSFSSYDEGEPSLSVNNIGPEQVVTGYLNMSFQNESGDNLIKVQIVDGVNIEKQMTLFDFMKKASDYGINFNCWNNNILLSTCDKVFAQQDSNSIYSGTSGENYVGFYVSGEDITVTKMEFDIQGQGTQAGSCGVVPFSIDLFNDGQIDYEYVYPSSQTCNKIYPDGFSESTSFDLITDTPYCETINLTYKTGKVRVGGKIKLFDTSHLINSQDLTFTINGNVVAESCSPLQQQYPTQPSFKDVWCDIETYLSPDNYTVCVYSSSNAIEVYGIMRNANNVRGLYIEPYTISSFNQQVHFNSTFYNQQTGRNLLFDINSFLQGKDCSNGCLIPMLINSTGQFQLSNLDFRYQYSLAGNSGITVLEDFSSLSIEYPEIETLGYVAIPLEAFNISSPANPGTYTFKVYYKGNFIDSQDFDVEEVPVIVSIIPSEVMLNEQTQFFVYAYSPKDNEIVGYSIDWGDGSSDTSTDGYFNHKYSEAGTYSVRVEVTDNETLTGVAYFSINVGITFNSLNSTINNAIEKINSFEYNLSQHPWILEKLNIHQIKEQLNNLSTRLLALGENANISELASIKQEFDSLKPNIPISLETYSTYSPINYYVGNDSIDVGLISSLTSEQCSTTNTNCKKAVLLWNNQNVQMNIEGEKKKITFYDGNTEVVSLIRINVNSNSEGKLLVKLSPSLASSQQQYSDLGNALMFNLSSGTNEFDISYFQDIDPYSIQIFAIPASLSSLPKVEEDISGEPEKYQKKENKLPLIMSIILLVIVIAGLFIIWWPHLNKAIQQKKFEKEKKLFSSRADYYNLMNFVTNSLRSGTDEAYLRNKLLSVGWKKQQIDYVIKKVKKMLKPKI